MTPKEIIEQEIKDLYAETDKIYSKMYMYKLMFPQKPTQDRVIHLAKLVKNLRKLNEELDSFMPDELPY